MLGGGTKKTNASIGNICVIGLVALAALASPSGNAQVQARKCRHHYRQNSLQVKIPSSNAPSGYQTPDTSTPSQAGASRNIVGWDSNVSVGGDIAQDSVVAVQKTFAVQQQLLPTSEIVSGIPILVPLDEVSGDVEGRQDTPLATPALSIISDIGSGTTAEAVQYPLPSTTLVASDYSYPGSALGSNDQPWMAPQVEASATKCAGLQTSTEQLQVGYPVLPTDTQAADVFGESDPSFFGGSGIGPFTTVGALANVAVLSPSLAADTEAVVGGYATPAVEDIAKDVGSDNFSFAPLAESDDAVLTPTDAYAVPSQDFATTPQSYPTAPAAVEGDFSFVQPLEDTATSVSEMSTTVVVNDEWVISTTAADQASSGYAVWSTESPTSTEAVGYAVPSSFVSGDGSNSGLSTGNTTGGFIRTRGTKFVTSDGNYFYFEGSNNYYMTYYDDNSVTSLLDTAKQIGLKVMRIWAFIDETPKNGVVFQTFNPQSIHSDALKKLDFVLAEAQKRGIRLILTLTNNWIEFGGVASYVKAYNGQYHDEFFVNENMKNAYKTWVQAVVTRVNSITNVQYKNDATIMSWELINEIRCKGTSGDYGSSSGNCNVATTTAWATEMCQFIKSIDSNHMVSLGDEGFYAKLNGKENDGWPYSCEDGVDFEKFMNIDCLDFGTFHFYAEDWDVNQSTEQWGIDWIVSHANTAKAVNKPVILEEYASKDKPMRRQYYQTWQQAVLDNDLAGSMSWLLVSNASIPDYDGYSLYGSGGSNDCDAVSLLTDAANKMNSKCIAAN